MIMYTIDKINKWGWIKEINKKGVSVRFYIVVLL